MAMLLDVQGLQAFYGPTQVLHGIDFNLQAGEIIAILGANGAGKTTTMRALCAMVRTRGRVILDGMPIEKKSTEAIARLGVAHVPQGRGTFERLSVADNLRLGALIRARGENMKIAGDMERMFAYFPVLRERRRQQAGTLSGGEQQMLAVARALMLRPRLLLLDEPSFGLAPLVVEELFDALAAVNREQKVAMVLVEQNASLALHIAGRAYLLETGRVVMSDSAAAMREDVAVRQSYLGY